MSELSRRLLNLAGQQRSRIIASRACDASMSARSGCLGGYRHSHPLLKIVPEPSLALAEKGAAAQKRRSTHAAASDVPFFCRAATSVSSS